MKEWEKNMGVLKEWSEGIPPEVCQISRAGAGGKGPNTWPVYCWVVVSFTFSRKKKLCAGFGWREAGGAGASISKKKAYIFKCTEKLQLKFFCWG